MKILMICSSFNGLTQRAWLELRSRGHEVTIELAISAGAMTAAVDAFRPDLVVCPFLRERVPAEVWDRYRTIIIHPGPMGDRGPSSLDWAITDAEPLWGVTALQAVEEMDAGPIWGTRLFPLDATPPRKSALYNGPVADAAAELILEVVTKAVDPSFVPTPLDYGRRDVIGRLRPSMRQADRSFSWSDGTDEIVRRIRAADGSPGVHTTLRDTPVAVFDAHPGLSSPGEPGTIALRRHGAVLVRTGDGAVWVGHVTVLPPAAEGAVKLPATVALGDGLAEVAEALPSLGERTAGLGHDEITYRRGGPVGVLKFDFYNGAMSTAQCRRLARAVRHAATEDTRVLLLRGGDVFSNGIHLNVIDAAPNPASEAWRNINAIDDVCREIINCTHQLVVTSVAGNAGAGGVMMALGADRVVLRDGAVLNPHYGTMGLFGSEYWTYVLPRRVGPQEAQRLTAQCLPIGSVEAARIGLADEVLKGRPAAFEAAVVEYAGRLAVRRDFARLLEDKCRSRALAERRNPLETYRVRELAEMSRDMFDDRNGFADARRAFVTKRKPTSTPSRLGSHWETAGAALAG
jgi:putative two-component system hydrogenase maturation factor HypX/HoxX